MKPQGLKPPISSSLKSELKLRPTNPVTVGACASFGRPTGNIVAGLLDDDAQEFLLANSQVVGRGLLCIELGCWVGDNLAVNF